MVSREGLEPSYPEGPVSETVAYAIPPPGHGTERGNRTHLARLVEPVLSQRASSASWGSRESNTGRAPYQRAQVNRTVLPLNSSAELLLNTSLYLRWTTGESDPAAGAYKTPQIDQILWSSRRGDEYIRSGWYGARESNPCETWV